MASGDCGHVANDRGQVVRESDDRDVGGPVTAAQVQSADHHGLTGGRHGEVHQHGIGVRHVPVGIRLRRHVGNVTVGVPDVEPETQPFRRVAGAGRPVQSRGVAHHERVVDRTAVAGGQPADAVPVHVHDGVADAGETGTADRRGRAAGRDALEPLTGCQRGLRAVGERQRAVRSVLDEQLTVEQRANDADRGPVRRPGHAQDAVDVPGHHFARYRRRRRRRLGRLAVRRGGNGDGHQTAGVQLPPADGEQSAAGQRTARRADVRDFGVDEPESLRRHDRQRRSPVGDYYRAADVGGPRWHFARSGGGQHARDSGAANRGRRSGARAPGHGHSHLAAVGQDQVVTDHHLYAHVARPQRGRRFHEPDAHVLASGRRGHGGREAVVGRHRGVPVGVAVTDVVQVPARGNVPAGTPLVMVRVVAHVPHTGHATLGVHRVAVVEFVVHREVTVGAVVQPQYGVAVAERHVTVVGHQPLVVEAQVGLVDGRATDRVVEHLGGARHVQYDARHLHVLEKRHEPGHVVGHLYLVNVRQIGRIRHPRDGRHLRTIGFFADGQRQPFPVVRETRLTFQRPDARCSLTGAFLASVQSRTIDRYRVIGLGDVTHAEQYLLKTKTLRCKFKL